MILVLNAILEEKARERFDRVTVPRFAALASQAVAIAHLGDGEDDFGHEGRTHLVVTGSELRASEPHERDEEVYGLIRAFVEEGKPVLGLCWGHQMVAKALAGQGVCRPSATPEFGWRRITFTDNPLFEGIDRLISTQSHYDEVFDLPEPFRVIASTDDCQVQAFQVGDAPIWGVQFHPEIAHDQGRGMLERNLRDDPSLERWFHDELEDPSHLDVNAMLFENFFMAGVGAVDA